MLAVMQELPLEFEPGSQWSYSNSGYLVLGQLTTKLAGKHWSDYQSERIFQPLGMATTRVISKRDLVPHRAAGYALDEAGDRVRSGKRLAAATELRCFGEDELAPAARPLDGDGAERGVDCFLTLAKSRFVYRFLFDAERRVVRFSWERR